MSYLLTTHIIIYIEEEKLYALEIRYHCQECPSIIRARERLKVAELKSTVCAMETAVPRDFEYVLTRERFQVPNRF